MKSVQWVALGCRALLSRADQILKIRFMCKNPHYNHIHDNFCTALWLNPYLSSLDF